MSAHTSAGKTVVAEYATALALKQGQRVVYTSPLKVGSRMGQGGAGRVEWPVSLAGLVHAAPPTQRTEWEVAADGGCGAALCWLVC